MKKKTKFNKNALKVEDWSYILQPFLPKEVFGALQQMKVEQNKNKFLMVKDEYVVRYMGLTYYPEDHDLSGVVEALARKLVKAYMLYGFAGSLGPICMQMSLVDKIVSAKPLIYKKRAVLLSYPALPWKAYGASAIDGFCFQREGWLPPLYGSKEENEDQFAKEEWYGWEEEGKKKK
jgi:hypothetical protein